METEANAGFTMGHRRDLWVGVVLWGDRFGTGVNFGGRNGGKPRDSGEWQGGLFLDLLIYRYHREYSHKILEPDPG